MQNASQDSLSRGAVEPLNPPRIKAPDVSAHPASTNQPPTENVLEDRRTGPRRELSSERAFAPLDEEYRAERGLPKSWRYLIVTMTLSVLTAFALTRVWPGIVTFGALAASLFGVSCIRFVAGRVADQGRVAEALGAVLVAIVPLFLFGLGITRWAEMNGLAWEAAFAILLSVGAISATYLRRQPGLVLAAQGAIWCSAYITNDTLIGMAGMMVAALLATLVGHEQSRDRLREEELRAAKDRAQTRARDILSDYEETGQGWFWETDRRSQLTYVSAPVAKSLGRVAEDLIGEPLTSLFDLQEADEMGERSMIFHLSTRSAFNELPVRPATEEDGLWWSISGRPIYDNFDNFIGFRGSGTDLTERKRSEEEVSRLANFDSLTGLANRHQISQVLDKILTSPQIANRECAVFLLDLDRFKHVNDTLGHPAGDALLKEAAQRLKSSVGDHGQVGRIGGDEFKVVMPGKISRGLLENLAREIIHALSQPYAIQGQRVIIGASLGIALAPIDGVNVDDIVRNADLALYAAKDGGRGRYHFFDEDLHIEAEARAQLEDDLRDAMAQGDLQLVYQPIISATTEEVTGFEALLRWQHPTKGWISPERFVAAAEDTGLIEQLGSWALRTACQDLAQMPHKVRVAVNVSPLQFANPDLPIIVTQAITQAGILPDQLELEITESVFLSDDEGTDAMFKALKRIGVRLALDDFGTGYSSLGYLKTAPFDKIKIDQSFVRDATEEGSRNGAIIASITSLAQALGMETTAEGVETMDQLDLVRKLGCSHVQGYIYDKPLSIQEAHERLTSRKVAVARGPRSSRAPRQSVLRKVVMEYNGNRYDAKIRNISTTGAMIEGICRVPAGTGFKLQIAQGFLVNCTARWSVDDRTGVEFSSPLQCDANGRILAVQARSVHDRSSDSQVA